MKKEIWHRYTFATMIVECRSMSRTELNWAIKNYGKLIKVEII